MWLLKRLLISLLVTELANYFKVFRFKPLTYINPSVIKLPAFNKGVSMQPLLHLISVNAKDLVILAATFLALVLILEFLTTLFTSYLHAPKQVLKYTSSNGETFSFEGNGRNIRHIQKNIALASGKSAQRTEQLTVTPIKRYF